MVSDTHNEPTSPPLQPFSSSLGPDLTTPTTFFCHIDPLRDTVEKTWPSRHVDRAKVGSDIIQEDRTTGARHFGAYQVDDKSAKPDRVYRVPGMTQQTTKPTARNLSFTFLIFKTFRSIFIYLSFKIFKNRYISYKLFRSIFLYIFKPFRNL